MSNIKNIAILVSCMDEEYQNKILNGIRDCSRKEHFNIYVFSAFGGNFKNENQDIGEYNIFKLINYKKFDGIILLTNTITSERVKEYILSKVKDSNVCAVSIGCDLIDTYNINIDNFKAMYNMVNHFIEFHGFNKINYISGMDDNNESRERLMAYKKALKDHNIPIDEDRIYHGNFRSEDGVNAVNKFISSKNSLPQVIVCANDVMALSTINTLNSYGLKVPQNICVSGFDRIYEARNYSPEITTVDRPLYEVGNMACHKIMKHINRRPQEYCEYASTKLVFTESCGCHHVREEKINDFRIKTYNIMTCYRNGIREMTSMASDLAEANSIEELLCKLKRYVLNIKCKEFYLCLCENWYCSYDAETGFIDRISNDGYTRNVISVLSYFDNQFIISNKQFLSEDIVPIFDIMNNQESKEYYVSPIHFNEKCFGYCVVQGGEYPLHNPMFHTWVTNIGTAIENIRNKTNLKAVISELDRLYVIDNLSNIYNRNGFSRFAETIYQKACANKDEIMVLFIDLDGLKYINDKFGHKEGDNAILEVANAIKKCCCHQEVFARFGGDEFVIFSANYNENRIKALCDSINSEFDNYNEKSGKPYKIGASMGYHITVADANISIQNIINVADAKMYELKKKKKMARGQQSQPY